MLIPYVLSLSKHYSFLATEEGQPFDKLRANGWRYDER